MRAQSWFLLVTLAAAGCDGSGADADRVTLGDEGDRPGGLPAEVQVPIDSGNAAYRGGDYASALRYYRVAADRAPGEVTPWIGVSMAAGALQDVAVQDSANAMIQQLAPDLLAEGAHGPAQGGVHP
jgi:hypothetical protein